METPKYQEILLLADYWQKVLGGKCTISCLYDGYKLTFPNGANVIQRRHSYGSDVGCVEFAGVDDDIDYSAIDYQTARNILEAFHDELSKKA